MIVGLDVGYYKTAVAVSGSRQCFPGNQAQRGELQTVLFESVACKYVESLMSVHRASASMLVRFQGDDTEYAVGQSAIDRSGLLINEESERWIESQIWRILALAALGQVSHATRVDLDVVVGLPISTIQNDGAIEHVRAVLNGSHSIKLGDRGSWQKLEVRVVRVVPQPFGCVLDRVLDDRGTMRDQDLARGRFGVLDVGGGTTQVLTVQRLQDLPDRRGSMKRGGLYVARLVRQWLRHNCPGLELSDFEISRAIVAGHVFYYGDQVDLTPAINAARETFGEAVVAFCASYWGEGADLDRVFLCGGAQAMVAGTLAERYQHAETVPDPQLANVRGFLKYGLFLSRQSSY